MTEQIDLEMPPVRHALQVSFKEQADRLTNALTKSCKELVALQYQTLENKSKLSKADALVTAMMETTHELASYAEEAQAAHDLQIRFLTMIAHELRNPLSPIKTAALLLGSGRIDHKQLASIKAVIEFQVTHLSRLIDDLMEISRSSVADFQFKQHRIDLIDILNTTVQMCRPIMARRHQHFALRMPRHAIMVNGDPMRLVQIFSNLLDNASKYTPNGGEIGLTVEMRGGSVSITVVDTGMGIGEKALPFIFDLYTQGPSVSDAEHRRPGFGIGLYVVRSLVAAHQGHIVATSHGQNRGSKFVVTLPLPCNDASLN